MKLMRSGVLLVLLSLCAISWLAGCATVTCEDRLTCDKPVDAATDGLTGDGVGADQTGDAGTAGADGAGIDGSAADATGVDGAASDGAVVDGAGGDVSATDGAGVEGAASDGTSIDGAETDVSQTDSSGGDVSATDGAGGDVSLTDGAGIEAAQNDGPPPDTGAPDVSAGKPKGETCGTTIECAAGLFCVDGVCCNQACSGRCQYCADAASKGTCIGVSGAPRKTGASCPAGTHPTCAAKCDGQQSDCLYPDEQQTCNSASCASSTTLNKAYVCNKAGDCVPPSPAQIGCGDYVCANDACRTTYTSVVDCSGSKVCNLDYGTCGALHYTAVSTRAYHTCAVVANGNVRCWGRNDAGQVGDGTTANVNRPAAVSTLANIVDVATGGNFTCAIAGGSVYCWGSNDQQQPV